MNDKTKEAMEALEQYREYAHQLWRNDRLVSLQEHTEASENYNIVSRALEDGEDYRRLYEEIVDALDEVLDVPDCTGKNCDAYGHDDDCEFSALGKHARRYIGELKAAFEAQRVPEGYQVVSGEPFGYTLVRQDGSSVGGFWLPKDKHHSDAAAAESWECGNNYTVIPVYAFPLNAAKEDE
jgi:hypothetical protein